MRELIDIINAPLGASLLQSLDAIAQSLDKWLASRQLTAQNMLWARIYMSDPANQLPIFEQHKLCVTQLAQCAVSYIGQPLLNGSKLALLFSAAPDGNLRKTGTPDKLEVTSGETSLLMHSVRLTDHEAQDLTPLEQTKLIFDRHIEWLASRGLTLKDNCVRTWLYVRDIDYNYAPVVKGRNEIFEREGLTPSTHFIASTGIAGYTASTKAVVAIDFLSVDKPDFAPRYLNALDYLNHTHEYGVAFERGTQADVTDQAQVFISGTASIDCHGNCLHIADPSKQTDRLFLNIAQLLLDAKRTLADITYLVAYLRDITDAPLVEKYLQTHFPTTPYLVVEASVCRPQWLVEVECVAR